MVGLTDVAALYSDGIPEGIEGHGMDFVQSIYVSGRGLKTTIL